jgi:hypothetical protein
MENYMNTRNIPRPTITDFNKVNRDNMILPKPTGMVFPSARPHQNRIKYVPQRFTPMPRPIGGQPGMGQGQFTRVALGNTAWRAPNRVPGPGQRVGGQRYNNRPHDLPGQSFIPTGFNTTRTLSGSIQASNDANTNTTEERGITNRTPEKKGRFPKDYGKKTRSEQNKRGEPLYSKETVKSSEAARSSSEANTIFPDALFYITFAMLNFSWLYISKT